MRLFSRRGTAPIGGLLGIETGPQGVALAVVQRDAGQAQPVLSRCEFLQGEVAAHAELLKQAVLAHGLAGMPVNFLLHPATYQMFLLEAPDVPANELRAGGSRT